MGEQNRPSWSVCSMCQKPVDQPKTGRPRKTCSKRCRQRKYRRSKGQQAWVYKRLGKQIQQRRALPLEEHSFERRWFKPVLELSYKRSVYECMACSQPYLVERIRTGGAPRPYCSDYCED